MVPFDLTRGGSSFVFDGGTTIKQQSGYVQDDITAGAFSFKLGLRFDHYDGLSTKSLAQPRLGVAYAIPHSGTILRASYGRTLETPYNENLVLTSSADAAVFGTGGVPLPAGTRDQLEVGGQQAFGRWLVADVGYFKKHTTNGYDFGALFDTPIFFPVSWDHSKPRRHHRPGDAGRAQGIQRVHGVRPHQRDLLAARHRRHPDGSAAGRLPDRSRPEVPADHQRAVRLRQSARPVGGDLVALRLRPRGRVGPRLRHGAHADGRPAGGIGLYCGGTFAALGAPITSCGDPNRGATRLRIPADGTEDDVANPPRIAPRNLFDIGIGADNLLHTEKTKLKVRLSVVNLTNREALYNFLSTFSGTHFVTPRAVQFQAGVTF